MNFSFSILETKYRYFNPNEGLQAWQWSIITFFEN